MKQRDLSLFFQEEEKKKQCEAVESQNLPFDTFCDKTKFPREANLIAPPTSVTTLIFLHH